MSLTKASFSMIEGIGINASDHGMSASASAAVNAAALQAAIDASPNPGQIYLPSGLLDIDATVNINKRISLIGSVAASRGSPATILRWTGLAGTNWDNGGKMFDVAPGSSALGTTFNGLAFNTTKDYTTFIDGTGSFNMMVQYCQFSGPTYTKAITVKETSTGAQDGAFWTRICNNNFSNTWVEVLDDSNATWIVENNFWAELNPLSGSSLFIRGDINAVHVLNNSFEGTWASGIYAVDVASVFNFSFHNNRIENYTGGSMKLSTMFYPCSIENNLFNTPPQLYGGLRGTSAHGLGQGLSDLNNYVGNKSLSPASDLNNLDGVFSGKNLFKQGPFNLDWSFGNCSYAIIQNGSAGLRTPVLRMHTPTGGSSYGAPTFAGIGPSELALAIQNGWFVTAVFIVKAKSSNVANSVVFLDTGDTVEYFSVPKDDKWRVIKVNRRMAAGDTVCRPTAYLSYASTYNAADELFIGGVGLFVGTAGAELPFFDGWSSSPASASNTFAWARGETVRNVAPSSGNPVGWVCTASGSPGTWAGYGAVI